MNQKLRWGVLGAGQIAKVFCNAMRFSETSELRAVASTDPRRALELGQFSGLSPRVEQSYAHLLQNHDVDAIYIANLNHQHYPWALASLQAGKHTLIEKPITLNETQLNHLLHVAKQEQRLLMEAFMYRCHPQLDHLRSHIEKETIGKINMMNASFGYKAAFNPQNRLFQKAWGGGALYDVGCYPSSMAIWLSGILTKKRLPNSINTECFKAKGKVGTSGVDEEAELCFVLNDGTLIQLQTSIVRELPNQVILEGSHGRIIVKDPWLPSSSCRFADAPLALSTMFSSSELLIEQVEGDKSIFNIERIDVDRDLFTYEIDHFAEIVTQRSPSKVPLQDSLANIQLLEHWLGALHDE